jgi:hypothetical protein
MEITNEQFMEMLSAAAEAPRHHIDGELEQTASFLRSLRSSAEALLEQTAHADPGRAADGLSDLRTARADGGPALPE